MHFSSKIKKKKKKKKKNDSFTQILGLVTFHYFIQKSCFHDIYVCNK